MKTKIPFVLASIFYISSLTIAEQNTKLLFVQIIFRHGDRAPVELYPNDPNSASFWPEGLGKLTKLGKKQHYVLGKYFRSRYQNFTTSSPLEVEVTSTDLDRCLKSAETNIAAFFAPEESWMFEETLKWQPLSVRYIPNRIDKYLEVFSYCPRATQEQQRILHSPEGQKFLAEHKEMFENLTFYSGNPIREWTTASYLYDVLMIERKYNLTFPSWAIPYWDELRKVADLSFFWSFDSPLLHRLRAGPLLGKIVENFKKKINGETPHMKFQLYFTHDSNIAVVLEALNLFNKKAPPYCASVGFELHEDKAGMKFVRLFYQNSSAVEKEIRTPHLLTLEGCAEFCPLDYFINYTLHLIPEDWDAECQLDKTFVEKIKEQQVTIGWFFILVAVIIVAMSIYTLWRIYARRQDKYAYHLMPMS